MPVEQTTRSDSISQASVAAAWPGGSPTLDSVMWELRRIDERLRYHGETWKMDAALLKRLADHHENPAANSRPVATPKQKSAFIRQAEAHLVFGAYCDKERQRLAEKARQLEQGTFDVAKDDAWRISNEEIAKRAIEMEKAA